MHRMSLAVGVVCFTLGATLGTSPPALASGGEPTNVVAVHQDSDGTLWFNSQWDRMSRRFINGRACWVDHDHIRLGGWGNKGCLFSRP